MFWPDGQRSNTRFVVDSIAAAEIDPDDPRLARQRAQLPPDVPLGRFLIVMPAADRSLLEIFQAERPGLNKTRIIMREGVE